MLLPPMLRQRQTLPGPIQSNAWSSEPEICAQNPPTPLRTIILAFPGSEFIHIAKLPRPLSSIAATAATAAAHRSTASHTRERINLLHQPPRPGNDRETFGSTFRRANPNLIRGRNSEGGVGGSIRIFRVSRPFSGRSFFSSAQRTLDWLTALCLREGDFPPSRNSVQRARARAGSVLLRDMAIDVNVTNYPRPPGRES